MKTKIALILCLIMCFSCLLSCENTPDTSDSGMRDSSLYSCAKSESIQSEEEILQEYSDDSSSPENEGNIVTIPENALYFKDEYYFPYWESILSFDDGLNEWHSNNAGIKNLIHNNDYTADEYYYVGVRLRDYNITDGDELEAKNERMLKQVGFILTEEPYLKTDYVSSLLALMETSLPTEEINEAFTTHAQNLMPNVDLSEYEYPDGYGYGYLLDFSYDYTGYITIDGLLELVDNYTGVLITWLPAPDDRARFLTYICGKKIEE